LQYYSVHQYAMLMDLQ